MQAHGAEARKLVLDGVKTNGMDGQTQYADGS